MFATGMMTGLGQVRERHQCGDQGDLHVRSATAGHRAVDNLCTKRRALPLRSRFDRYGVYMRVQDQRSTAAGATDDPDDIRAPRVVEHGFKAAAAQRFVSWQSRVWKNKVVLPVRREIPGNLRGSAGHLRQVWLPNCHLCAESAQLRRDVHLASAFLTCQARNSDRYPEVPRCSALCRQRRIQGRVLDDRGDFEANSYKAIIRNSFCLAQQNFSPGHNRNGGAKDVH